jgi:hypothetical protein
LLESSFLLKNKFRESELFSDVWQCNEKLVGKSFLVFGYIMKNKLENNLLMFYFSQIY